MKKENNNYDFESEATAFNMSLATLERINEIFKYNNECSLKLNIQGWLLGLQTLLLEVSPMMNEAEETKFNELYDNIDYVQKPQTEIESENNWEQRLNIQKADSYLRKILWNKGLTMTKQVDITKKML